MMYFRSVILYFNETWILFSASSESTAFNNSGTSNNTVANKITISKDKFKQGENELICTIFKNPYVNPAGLLANLILTNNDNSTVTYETNSSWLFTDIFRPKIANRSTIF